MSYIRKAFVALAVVCAASALPIKREVPQGTQDASRIFIVSVPWLTHKCQTEHSHQKFLTSVQTNLQLNNPDEISDSVFGLLGAAAAIKGAGKITVTTFLK